METFVATLKARGVGNVVFDTSITRGFDYYTGNGLRGIRHQSGKPARTSSAVGATMDSWHSLAVTQFLPSALLLVKYLLVTSSRHILSLNEDTKKPQLYLGTSSASDILAAQAFADTLRVQGAVVCL